MAMTIERSNQIVAEVFKENNFRNVLEEAAAMMAVADGAEPQVVEQINMEAFERNVTAYVADALALKVANAIYQTSKKQ